MNAQFIAIEGIDGAGKSTLHPYLVHLLHDAGVTQLVTTHEPGGTAVGEDIRTLLNKPYTEPLVSKTELLLMYASRVQLVEQVIKPALQNGQWILSDRHELSTRAYQGGGRQMTNTLCQTIYQAVLADITPDLTIYLDIEPTLALERIQQRGKLGRIEATGLAFFQRVRDTYLTLLHDIPNKIIIDAAQPLTQVQTTLAQALRRHYPDLNWK